MGLDITTIKDQEGASLYIVHNGTTAEVLRFELLSQEILQRSDRQTYLVDQNSSDARKIIEFYALSTTQLPIALVIKDDDQIAYQWQGDAIPAADMIVYYLEQLG